MKRNDVSKNPERLASAEARSVSSYSSFVDSEKRVLCLGR